MGGSRSRRPGEELLEGILSGDREKITAASGWLTGASAEAPDFSSLTGVTRLDQWVELADRVPADCDWPCPLWRWWRMSPWGGKNGRTSALGKGWFQNRDGHGAMMDFTAAV